MHAFFIYIESKVAQSIKLNAKLKQEKRCGPTPPAILMRHLSPIHFHSWRGAPMSCVKKSKSVRRSASLSQNPAQD